MIHILPRIEYSIDSAKSPEDINSILNSLVDSGETSLGDALNAGFSGEVNPSGFKIISDVSWIYLRNRFSPVILGTIRAESEQTVIDIKMRPYLSVQICLAVFFGWAVFGLLGGLFIAYTEGMDGVSIFFSPVAFFVFIQAFARIGFYFPAKRVIRKLDELLK